MRARYLEIMGVGVAIALTAGTAMMSRAGLRHALTPEPAGWHGGVARMSQSVDSTLDRHLRERGRSLGDPLADQLSREMPGSDDMVLESTRSAPRGDPMGGGRHEP